MKKFFTKVGYIIECTEAANDLSHDWGTEFYHKKEDAQSRCDELEEITLISPDAEFNVRKVRITTIDDK